MISFNIKQPAKVKIAIYSLTGALVRVLADTQFTAGNHDLVWDGTGNNGDELSSGVYLYKLQTNGSSSVKRLVMIK
jgi:flagellar hook assembly protein FlgD